MNSSLIPEEKWTLVTIDDPAFLPGKSIYDVIQLLLKVIPFKYVIINEIYGVTKAIADLEKKENTIMEIKELMDDLCKVRQFDWGDFFLFKDYPSDWWERSKDLIDYPNLVVQSDTTIRAVDDQYIYIYTPLQEVIKTIRENYVIESIKTDSLDKLDYPF